MKNTTVHINLICLQDLTQKKLQVILQNKEISHWFFGSATPDMSTFEKAKEGKIELLKLTKRANKSSLPNVEIVDLRQELAKRKQINN